MNAATLATATTRQPMRLRVLIAPLMRRLAQLRPGAASAGPVVRQLDQGATDWIAHPLGCTVRCETGTLWLTFDHEPVDVVLEAGQSHCCAVDSKLAIHALAPARVSVLGESGVR